MSDDNVDLLFFAFLDTFSAEVRERIDSCGGMIGLLLKEGRLLAAAGLVFPLTVSRLNDVLVSSHPSYEKNSFDRVDVDFLVRLLGQANQPDGPFSELKEVEAAILQRKDTIPPEDIVPCVIHCFEWYRKVIVGTKGLRAKPTQEYLTLLDETIGSLRGFLQD